MLEHPPWCQPAACTAYHQPAPSLRRAHRGGIARIDIAHGSRASSITTMLIQDIGAEPQVVVTAAGWAQSRMVDLGTAGVRQLIDNLTEQLRAANATAPTGARR